MLKIYWADADLLPPADPSLYSEYRTKKLSSIKPERLRRASACAETLLIAALGREDAALRLPLQIETDDFGKPYLIGSDICFSLSHSSHFAACAISDRPIGLDIQLLSPCSEALIRRFFTDQEQEYILSGKDRDGAFTRLWCRKESFLKAVGLGLRLDLRSFDVSAPRPVVPYLGEDYAFREMRSGDLFFCVCAQKDSFPSDDFPDLIRFDP